MKYLRFVPKDNNFDIFNNDNINIGRLEKVRVGQWMSWVLFLNPDCYVSAGCIDEISELTEVREAIKELNAQSHKKVNK